MILESDNGTFGGKRVYTKIYPHGGRPSARTASISSKSAIPLNLHLHQPGLSDAGQSSGGSSLYSMSVFLSASTPHSALSTVQSTLCSNTGHNGLLLIRASMHLFHRQYYIIARAQRAGRLGSGEDLAMELQFFPTVPQFRIILKSQNFSVLLLGSCICDGLSSH